MNTAFTEVKGGYAVPATRREAARLATHNEILETGRRLLADGGRASVTLRAVATEIGMTAPGIYRYFASYEDLLGALTDSVAGELADALETARDALPTGDVEGRIVAVCRGFREWAVSHHREYELLFGLPSSPPGQLPEPVAKNNGARIAGAFFGCFVDLWRTVRFPVPAPEEVRPELARELTAFIDLHALPIGPDLPIGVLRLFLDCWVRLYGLVTLEVFGHLRFALADVHPLFEATLREMAERLGFSLDDAGPTSDPLPEVS